MIVFLWYLYSIVHVSAFWPSSVSNYKNTLRIIKYINFNGTMRSYSLQQQQEL